MEAQVSKRSGAQAEIEIRECTTIEEFDACIALQREAFSLSELEISPRRHLIVSRRAGGWTLGAFVGDSLVGFVHQLIAVRLPVEIIGYSHMMAVAQTYQNQGVGARLKWAQRERALAEGRNLIKWTWDPMQARNAHFNLNRLGVTVSSYAVNFYGTDYNAAPGETKSNISLDSDRLFADWYLDSDRVALLAEGRAFENPPVADATIEIPSDWPALIRQDSSEARGQQLRVRGEFEKAFVAGLVCRGFESDETHPRYLLYRGNVADRES